MARHLPMGDSAITVEFGNEISPDLHRQVRAYYTALLADPPDGFREAVPTYRSVTVHFEPGADVEEHLKALESLALALDLPPGALHDIGVVYDGPDLAEVARLHDLTPERVVSLHSGAEYLVYCVGFTPGFAFLGGLPDELHTPRLDTPRKLVPAGSVAIGGQQTGVYPVASPGGWRLLGRTNFTFFDVAADPPCPISLGDRVRFVPTDGLPAQDNTRMQMPAGKPLRPVLEIVKPGLFTTVQDDGRWGYQAFGVSVGGAMDPLALHAANARAGNELRAAALELTLAGPTLKARAACAVALAGAHMPMCVNGKPAEGLVQLRRGDVIEIGRATAGARAYLALAGGIDVPMVLGSRSTYARAGIAGRALEPGDLIAAGSSAGQTQEIDVALPAGDEVTVRVILGPQDDYFSPETVQELLTAAFTISTDADRMGYRLAGPPLKHAGPAEIVSDGIALGSIQVPPHGNPIVMLAERPSAGGYPKIATVVSEDVRILAQCKPGMRLRFRLAQRVQAEELPTGDVRELLATMRRTGARQLAFEAQGLTLRLERRSGS